MQIECDLMANYVDLMRTSLKDDGYVLKGDESAEQVMVAFFNLRKRAVSAKPRNVLIADTFHVPDEFIQTIQVIKVLMERGDDLTPYLSKRIKDLSYSDPLLNDWGIHHLHLGDAMDATGFAKRTGPLLFVLFTEAEALLIAVAPHGSWSNQQLIETIHRNWPWAIDSYRANVTGLSFIPTNDDVASFRGNQINLFVQVSDGTVYAPVGGGQTADGSSALVMFQVLRTKRVLRLAEQEVRTHAGNEDAFRGREVVNFQLQLGQQQAYAVEIVSGFRYRIW